MSLAVSKDCRAPVRGNESSVGSAIEPDISGKVHRTSVLVAIVCSGRQSLLTTDDLNSR